MTAIDNPLTGAPEPSTISNRAALTPRWGGCGVVVSFRCSWPEALATSIGEEDALSPQPAAINQASAAALTAPRRQKRRGRGESPRGCLRSPRRDESAP